MAFLDRADGCRLYYELHGDPADEPIVLLEGLGGDIHGWRRNIPHLAEQLHVIAYDFRGNGRSDAPDQSMSMATFVDDTVALLDHLELASAHLYGQSFGGMVVQELALSHPERVRTLILAATHCGGAHAVRSTARVPKGRPYLGLYSEAFALAHPEHVAEDLRVGRQNPQKPHGRRRQWEAMQEFDACDRLHEIRAPTLILHGTEDRTVDPANARMLADGIPGAQLLLLEAAGHVYHSERAEESDRAVLDFVRRHARG